MRIITLGTSAGRPTLERSASAVALDYEGEVFLFDCGEGTQVQLARSPLRWMNLSVICIGHLHGDHVNGLPGLIGTMALSGRTEALKVFGPRGIRKYLRALQEVRNLWVPFPFEIIEIQQSGILYETPLYTIETRPLDHVIECWGYVFREKNKPGHFDEKKAQELRIPFGPLRGKLVKGEDVILPDGKKVCAAEVVGPKRRGRSVAYCLDTKPCAGDIELATEVDLLIHEATFDKTLEHEMDQWGHSTTNQAAMVALAARAKKLLLTHISPRYQSSKFLLKEAQEVFKNTELAWDLDEFIIKMED